MVGYGQTALAQYWRRRLPGGSVVGACSRAPMAWKSFLLLRVAWCHDSTYFPLVSVLFCLFLYYFFGRFFPPPPPLPPLCSLLCVHVCMCFCFLFGFCVCVCSCACVWVSVAMVHRCVFYSFLFWCVWGGMLGSRPEERKRGERSVGIIVVVVLPRMVYECRKY